jgi:hypothetical protein
MSQPDGGRCTLSQAKEIMDAFEVEAGLAAAEVEVCEYEMDAAVVDELDEFELANGSETAKAHTTRYTKRFKDFLREHGLCDQIERLVPATLNCFLRRFY